MRLRKPAMLMLGLLLVSPVRAETVWGAPDSPFPVVEGSLDQQRLAVKHALNETRQQDPARLFRAANTAYLLNRIEDAAFLYYVANFRAIYDLQHFPPANDDPKATLSRLKEATSQKVVPALTENPVQYAAVLKRLTAWDCRPASDYVPAWSATPRSEASIPAQTCAETMRPWLARMQDILALLTAPGYSDALNICRRYRRATPEVRNTPEERQRFDEALALMTRVEQEQKRDGFAAAMRRAVGK